MTALEERRLGGTEMRPNSIGLGAAWWGRHSSEQETIAAIHRAIDLGINFIDTYPGPDEETWGKALAEVGRESVYLQAKVSRVSARRSDHSAASTRSSLEESLRALRTEYVDAVLIHGYDQRKDLDAEDMVDPLTEGNALDELLKMKAEGKVRHIGIGARSHKVLRRAIETGHIELVLTYLEYNLLTQAAAEDIFPVCRQHDVGVELASPLGMGLLTGTELRFEQEEQMIPGKEPRAGGTEIHSTLRAAALCPRREPPNDPKHRPVHTPAGLPRLPITVFILPILRKRAAQFAKSREQRRRDRQRRGARCGPILPGRLPSWFVSS